MSNKNLLSSRDKALQACAEQYEAAMEENKTFYLDADDFADLADWYGTRRRFDKAIEIAEYGLRLHPSNTELMIEYAYLLIDSGQMEKAREVARNFPESYLPEAKVLRAALLLSEGKLNDAEELLDTIEDKDDIANVIDVAYTFLEMGYPDKAKEWLDRAEDEHNDNAAYLAVMADYYRAKDMIEEAILTFNKLIDKDPYSATYWIALARCYFEIGEYNQTIDACDYALIGDDKLAEAYIIRGHSFFQLGNEEAALENYLEAQRLKALSSNFIYSFVGLCSISKGKWEEGLENMEKAIQINEEKYTSSPVLPNLYANAGLCLFKLGQKDKAHQYCQKAQHLAPEDPDAYVIEGRILIEEEKEKKGMALWAKAIQYSPYADTWNEIGMHSLELGYLNHAKTAFERVIEMDPTFPSINEKLCVLYITMFDKENFIKYNQKCACPFGAKEMEEILAIMERKDHQEMVNYTQRLIKSLKR